MQQRLANADSKEDAIQRKLELQNAKLSKENAQKALVKAQEAEEEFKQKKKKKQIKKKILDEKIDQANETQEEIVEQKADALRAKAKKMKTKKREGPEPEVVEAIRKGKLKGIDNVFNDEPSYEKSADQTESADTSEAKPKKMSYKKNKAEQQGNEGESSLKIEEDYTDSGKKNQKGISR